LLAAIRATRLVSDGAGLQMNSSKKVRWPRASRFLASCTQRLLDAVAAVSGFYYSHKYAAIARRLGRPQDAQSTPRRGFIIIQIDGLSYEHMKQAISKNEVPYLGRMIRDGAFSVRRWRCGLPSTTPASQAGIMFGNNHDIPAFRWYEKEDRRAIVCKFPAMARSMQDRVSAGRVGILRGGSSHVNVFDGGADSSLFTVSGIDSAGLFDRVRGIGFLVLFALNPFRTVRIVVLSIWEYLVGSFQRIKDMLAPGKPAPMQRFFVWLRILDNVIFREIQTFVAMLDIYRGVPSVYTTYYGYDELAHHYGPLSRPAMRSLQGIDKRIRQIDRLRRRGAGREYDLYVLSDHGMSSAIPFTKEFGQSLGEFVAGLPTEDVRVSEQYGDEQMSSQEARYLLGEFEALEGRLAEPLAKVARKTRQLVRQRILSDLDEELPDWDLLRRSDVVVRSSGSMAHLYFNVTSRQMDVSEIASLYPDLVVKLAAHPGVWFVAGREGGQVIIASSVGILSLDDEQQVAEGENPLGMLPEPDVAAEQVRRLVQFPHSGDLILMGAYDPGKQEVVCFEQQWACHGGLGGPQDYPFMVFPSVTGMNLDGVTNSEQLHEHFVRTYLQGDALADGLQEKGEESSPTERASKTTVPELP
jgi:hypothetical protein